MPRNPMDKKLAEHNIRPSQARRALKATRVKQLQNVPALRDAVALILEALGIQYDAAA